MQFKSIKLKSKYEDKVEDKDSNVTVANEDIKDKHDILLNKNQAIVTSIEVPDGGYGWLIVLASFLIQFNSVGASVGFGVYINHYYHYEFKDNDYSMISIIGTIAPVITALTSAVSGKLGNWLGLRMCTWLGSFLIVISYILASFANQIWHLILTQGILFGIGGGLIYVPANAIITQWFTKRVGLAIGIATSGSGIGGLVYSLLNSYLLPIYKFSWTLRINAIISAICLLFSCVVIKPFSPSNETKKIGSCKCVLSTPYFWLFSMAITLAIPAHIVTLFYLPPYATSLELNSNQGAILVAILNSMNAIGRILLGFLGDRIGHFNLFILCLFLSTASIILWRFAYNFTILIVFSILYGLPSGGVASLFPSACAELFGTANLNILLGIAFAPSGLGDLAGPPLAGLIYDKTKEYYNIIYYALLLYFISTAFALIIKVLSLFNKKHRCNTGT